MIGTRARETLSDRRSAARSLISLDDLTDTELFGIVQRSVAFAERRVRPANPLGGLVAGMYFSRPSTRTRTSFAAGALRLGAGVLTFGPAELQLSTGETIEDTGRVLAGMLDILIARTAGDPAMLREWGRHGGMAVINAMTADEHPTQAIADLATLSQHFGRLTDLRILYVGEGNNTAAALALGLSRCPGVSFELRTPPGYGLSDAVLRRALASASRSGAIVQEQHDMSDLPADLDVIYTTQWQTTGTTKPTPDWRETFAPFQVRHSMWRQNPRAVFMHDLPAHRGDEVTAEVLDGPASIAFTQAHNKMYSAMAVLEWSRGLQSFDNQGAGQ